MTMVIDIQVATGSAVADTNKVTDGLERMTDAEAAAKTGAQQLAGGLAELGAAFGVTGKESAAAGEAVDKLTGLTGRHVAILTSINAPAREWAEQLKALNGLNELGALSTQQYEQQLIKLQQSTGVTAAAEAQAAQALARQAEVYERIRGPMQRYEADLAALDELMRKGTITAVEHETELQRLAKQYGTMHGPVAPQNVPASEQQPQGDPSATLGSLTTGASALLAGGAAAGVVALGEHLEGLIRNFQDIQDVAITAANSVQRFTDANHSLIVVQDQQIALAHELHATYTQEVGLYARLAESADALSLSQSEITTLTKEFGEAVEVAGKPLDAADGIMRRFAYGLAAGKIETREMRSIMREIPAIADLWTQAFGATRQQVIDMVKDGRVSTEDLMAALLRGGQSIDQQFKKLQVTHKQAADQWLEDEKIFSQRYNTAVGGDAGHNAQAAVEALKQTLREGKEIFSIGGGAAADLVAEARKQYNDENRASIANFIEDAKNLTGVFRPLGDAYREWTADTAAVRAEVQKINEPIESARHELETLNKAFGAGKIDVDDYNKRLLSLSSTLNHGIPDMALKISQPIEQAKRELAALDAAYKSGAIDNQEAYLKARNAALATANGGRLPEAEKLSTPVIEAKAALDDLNQAQREGRVTAEAYRKEYDALVTTINDGRLPATIKLWESLTLPMRDAADGLRAVDALFRAGRLSVSEYSSEIDKATDALTKLIAAQPQKLPDFLAARAAPTSAYSGSAEVRYDVRDQLAAYQAQREKDLAAQQRDQLPFSSFTSVTGGAATVLPHLAEQAGTTSSAYEQMNAQLERARILADQYVEPAVKYEQTLKDISLALQTNSITQEQATAAQRRAKDALNSANEALEATKGPLDQYNAAIKKLTDQYEAGNISAQKYGQGVDAAKVAMLEATGAAQTFSGAMQIEWIKLKQGADAVGATIATNLVGDIDKLNNSLVTAANGGAVSWTAMADSMIQDLERVLLKALEVQAIAALFPSSGSSSSGAAASDVIGAIVGGIAGGAAGAASRSSPTGPGVYPTTSPGGYPGAAMPASSTSQRITIVNQVGSQVPLAAIASAAGHKTLVNVMRSNKAAIRSLVGSG